MRVFLCVLILLGASLGNAHELDSLNPGEWREIPNSAMQQVAYPKDMAGWSGGGVANIIEAWSGGAYDSSRDRLLIHGGGHADYAGNEIYGFDLDDLTWSRLTERSSDIGGSSSSGVYPDGKPRAIHSYNTLVYVPSIDSLCRMGGAALYPSGNDSTDRIDCFNFSNNSWSKTGDVQDAGIENMSALDPSTGNVYMKSRHSNAMQLISPSGDSSYVGETFGGRYKHTAAYDPEYGYFVFAGDGDYSIWDKNISDLIVESKSGGPSQRSPGMVYDPVEKQIIAWTGGSKIHVFDSQSKSWASKTASGDVPGSQSNWGTFGRFQYSKKYNVFVLVNAVDENVYVYRNSAGTGGPVDNIVPNSPEDLQAN